MINVDQVDETIDIFEQVNVVEWKKFLFPFALFYLQSLVRVYAQKKEMQEVPKARRRYIRRRL